MRHTGAYPTSLTHQNGGLELRGVVTSYFLDYPTLTSVLRAIFSLFVGQQLLVAVYRWWAMICFVAPTPTLPQALPICFKV